MKGRLITVLVGAMTAAMLVIVAVQVSWLESSAKLRKEVFDQSVEQSLQLVATWLSASHRDPADDRDPTLLRTDELARKPHFDKILIANRSVFVSSTLIVFPAAYDKWCTGER